MIEYTADLKAAVAQLADLEAQLDREIQELPATTEHIDKLIHEYENRCADIKRAYHDSKAQTENHVQQRVPCEFPRFAGLPLELQDLIWAFTLPGPRVVPIVAKKNSLGLTSPCAKPIILEVCRRSRRFVFSRGYELAFSSPTRHASIYFNFAIDTAYFEDFALISRLSSSDHAGDCSRNIWNLDSMKRIKKLAIGVRTLVCHDLLSHTCFSHKKTLLYNRATLRDLELLILAPFLTFEWIRFGDTDPSALCQYLFPLLQRNAYFWVPHRRGGIRSNGPAEAVNIKISPLTNATLYPWMTSQVQANWDAAVEQHCRGKAEYQIDPQQVIAVTRANMSLVDDFASICSVEYVEKVCTESGLRGYHDTSFRQPSQYRSFFIPEEDWLYPPWYFERPPSCIKKDV